ncbi:MAG: DUF115 domain-containing protein [Sandaracinaceae bacterium]|nr:DUF115 domain-containing protein [Sandaracinaceae bacterium]
MELASRNRARLTRWPAFAAWAEGASAADVTSSPHGESSVLVVDGVHLVAPLDPEAEAARLVREVDVAREEPWCFGLGEGRAIVRLLARDRVRRLHVVGLSRRATRATLDHRDAAWLEDPRVELHTPADVSESAFAAAAGARVLASAELRLAEPSALRDAALLELAAAHQERWIEGRRAVRAERADANAARFATDGDVALLFRTRPGAHAVIAAGGPSLLPVVQSVPRDEVLMIAVSTALAPLEARGIVPDVAVMVDTHPLLLGHVRALRRPEALSAVPLVYAADLDADVLAAWPGPRLAAHLALPGYADASIRRGVLFCSGTVAHTAIDLAVKMGARTVRLAGLDLAYPGGATHAEGAAFGARRDRGSVSVESVRGELVPTDLNFLGYLRDLERYIAKHPEVRFVNGSLAGARIRGTVHEPPTEGR